MPRSNKHGHASAISAKLSRFASSIFDSFAERQKGRMMLANYVWFPVSPLSIPFKFANQFSPPQTNEFSDESALKTQSTRDLKSKKNALVVDDVPDVTDMLSVLLTHAGYDVVTADSAAAAIAAAHQHQFDIVISDIGMPEMNGYDLARTLRAQPGYETIPMVAVTGYSMFDDRNRSLEAGFNAHLTKPIEPRALLDLIEHLGN